eukprot:1019071-Rhodomonas_salina.3
MVRSGILSMLWTQETCNPFPSFQPTFNPIGPGIKFDPMSPEAPVMKDAEPIASCCLSMPHSPSRDLFGLTVQVVPRDGVSFRFLSAISLIAKKPDIMFIVLFAAVLAADFALCSPSGASEPGLWGAPSE